MEANSYDDIFGQKARQRPNLFQNFLNVYLINLEHYVVHKVSEVFEINWEF